MKCFVKLWIGQVSLTRENWVAGGCVSFLNYEGLFKLWIGRVGFFFDRDRLRSRSLEAFQSPKQVKGASRPCSPPCNGCHRVANPTRCRWKVDEIHEINGIHWFPLIPWRSMKSMDSPWIQWKSMKSIPWMSWKSMKSMESTDFHGLHGSPWSYWIPHKQ